MSDITAGLNTEQRRAAEADDGPLLIIAGPGTGKTKTLTTRIAHLVASGRAQPQEILALTFTKKAAEEMRGRVQGLLNLDAAQRSPNIATFHALCYELLNGANHEQPAFITEPARLQLIKSLPRPAALKGLSARELGLLISRTKNLPPDEAPAKAVAALAAAYDAALTDQKLRDFDDLLLKTYQLLAGKAPALRWRYVLVDEFQDTNRLQYDLLKLLAGHDNLFVIGDPLQSIYGFRGASGDIFDRFKADFPGCRAITLTTNYRSSPEIVRASNAIFAEAPQLQAAASQVGQVQTVQILNEYSEAEWVVNEIQRAVGGADMLRGVSDDDRAAHRTLADFAVLYRSRAAVAAVQKALDVSGLPYQVAGEGSPYEKPEIQRVIAMLRTVIPAALPVPTAEGLLASADIVITPAIQQFLAALVRFPSVAAALAHIDAIAETNFYDPDADAVTLLTIHASKGLEFPVVFLIGAEEGLLPHKRADAEEEKRLFYVAITRAKTNLTLLHAKNRGGQPAAPSCFLTGLPVERTIDPAMEAQLRRLRKRQFKRSQQTLF